MSARADAAEIDQTDDALTDTQDESASDVDQAFDEEFGDVSDGALLTALDGERQGNAADAEIAEGLDEGEPSGESTEDAPTTGVDRGDGRDATGKFVGKGEQKGDATEATPEATQAATTAVPTDAYAEAQTAPAAPTWEPLAVKVDRAIVPLDGAQVTEANGYKLISVKAPEFSRFMQRVQRGHLYERDWRAIQERASALQQGITDLQAERSAPQQKSDEQIEAEHVLEAVKPFLKEIFDPQSLENLELKIKLAQRDHKESFATERKTYFDKLATDRAQEAAKTMTETDVAQQIQGVAATMQEVIGQFPDEFATLQPEQLKAAYQDLLELQRDFGSNIYWKDPADGQWYKNTQAVYARLKKVAASASAAPQSSPTTTASPAPGTTAAGVPQATGAPAGTAPRGSAGSATTADRFNRGVDRSARPAAPANTSLKNRRDGSTGTPAPRSRDERTTRGPAKTRAMIHEDELRAKKNAYLRSNSLDFEGDDEDVA